MLLATLVVGAVTLALDRSGQGPDPSTSVKVFLDCAGAEVDDEDDDCHLDYLREEIDFVEYVRDRSDADVHVLVNAGRDGRAWSGVHSRVHRPAALCGQHARHHSYHRAE